MKDEQRALTASGAGWMTTAVQAGPRLIRLSRRLRPTLHLPAVTALDEDFLARHRVSAVLWDVDGTLMPYHETSLTDGVRAALDLLAARGIPQALLSNCGDDRLCQLGVLFPELPVLKAYVVDGGGGLALRRLHRGQEAWSAPGQEALRPLRPIAPPAARLRPIRKPSAELIEMAIEALGAERDRVFMVGDQYFTDIAGANLAGIRSVKVHTIARRSFPPAIRTFQMFEALVYRVLYRGRRDGA